ncbi:MAG: hypothetical protein IT389_04645 [Nitrospira sp.]|nr:hypothetical protein [Nitrospira sp.]
MAMPLQWQPIELVNQVAATPPYVGTWIRTDRAQVLGGWLVRTLLIKREVGQPIPAAPAGLEMAASVALTFVPDPTLGWKP